jgi:nicotinate-nucleotide adenylyltransferase
MSPIGILGGTFDPVHYGHLRLAQEVADQLRLAEVRFVPSGTPPHRATPVATAADRLKMVRLATTGNSLFTVDARESASITPGYTVDTLTALRAEVGAEQSLVLLLGADAFLDLASWDRWHELFKLAHIAVATAAVGGRVRCAVDASAVCGACCACRRHCCRTNCRPRYLRDTDTRSDMSGP